MASAPGACFPFLAAMIALPSVSTMRDSVDDRGSILPMMVSKAMDHERPLSSNRSHPTDSTGQVSSLLQAARSGGTCSQWQRGVCQQRGGQNYSFGEGTGNQDQCLHLCNEAGATCCSYEYWHQGSSTCYAFFSYEFAWYHDGSQRVPSSRPVAPPIFRAGGGSWYSTTCSHDQPGIPFSPQFTWEQKSAHLVHTWGHMQLKEQARKEWELKQQQERLDDGFTTFQTRFKTTAERECGFEAYYKDKDGNPVITQIYKIGMISDNNQQAAEQYLGAYEVQLYDIITQVWFPSNTDFISVTGGQEIMDALRDPKHPVGIVMLKIKRPKDLQSLGISPHSGVQDPHSRSSSQSPQPEEEREIAGRRTRINEHNTQEKSLKKPHEVDITQPDWELREATSPDRKAKGEYYYINTNTWERSDYFVPTAEELEAAGIGAQPQGDARAQVPPRIEGWEAISVAGTNTFYYIDGSGKRVSKYITPGIGESDTPPQAVLQEPPHRWEHQIQQLMPWGFHRDDVIQALEFTQKHGRPDVNDASQLCLEWQAGDKDFPNEPVRRPRRRPERLPSEREQDQRRPPREQRQDGAGPDYAALAAQSGFGTEFQHMLLMGLSTRTGGQFTDEQIWRALASSGGDEDTAISMLWNR